VRDEREGWGGGHDVPQIASTKCGQDPLFDETVLVVGGTCEKIWQTMRTRHLQGSSTRRSGRTNISEVTLMRCSRT
jgi:hypothetical protein